MRRTFICGYKAPPRPPKYKHKTKGRNVITLTDTQIRINKRDGMIHFPKQINIPHLKTKVSSFKQVRIVPQKNCYVIEVIYKKQEEQLNLNKENVIAIDLGVNNICAITSNQQGTKPFLINGKPIKSINQFYNKELSTLQSNLKKHHNRHHSKRTNKLTFKRNNKINNCLDGQKRRY